MIDAPLFAHLNLDVADVERSIAFYESAFGLKAERRAGTARFSWDSFLLVLSAGEVRASDGFHVGFRVARAEDVDGWARRLREREVPLLTQPASANGVRVFRIADPDGYVIEIFAFVS